MMLKIDTTPKINTLKFSTLKTNYNEVNSPRSILKQSGLEFDHFRKYEPGHDDAKFIDWIASARSQETLVRVYSENTQLNIIFVVDISESMVYGTSKLAKIEYALEMTLNMIFGTLNYGDSVGILLFNDDVVKSYPLKNGLDNYYTIKEEIINLKEFGGKANLFKTVNYLIEFFREPHLVIVISDFLGYDNSLFDSLSLISDKFDIIGLMVYDKTDLDISTMPKNIKIKDPFTNESNTINTKKVIDMYKNVNLERVENLSNFFTALQKDFWMISTDQDYVEEIPKLIRKREYSF